MSDVDDDDDDACCALLNGERDAAALDAAIGVLAAVGTGDDDNDAVDADAATAVEDEPPPNSVRAMT